MGESELSRRASELVRTVEDLSDAIAALTERTEGAEERQRRSRRTIRLVIVGVALNLALSVLVVLIFQAQSRLSGEVLCPLYQVVLGAQDPAARDAMSPAQRSRYDQWVAVMRRGSHVLGCPS